MASEPNHVIGKEASRFCELPQECAGFFVNLHSEKVVVMETPLAIEEDK
jgi:hypothetical protein